MNRSIADLKRLSQDEISFQPALVYNFQVDASAVQMRDNWLVDQIMDADEISTIRFPSIKANNRPTSTGIPSSMPTITTAELMLRLIDVEVLLTSMIDPGNLLPPNVKRIALQADTLKRSIADGMHTEEDAELIIEAAAELTSTDAYNNRFSDSVWEEEYVPYKGNDSFTEARRHNDLDLIHHNNNQMRKDRKQRTLELTDAVMTPSMMETSSSASIPVVENVLHLEVQETPTIMTDAVHEVQHDSFILSALQSEHSATATNVTRGTQCRRSNLDPSNKPKSDFR